MKKMLIAFLAVASVTAAQASTAVDYSALQTSLATEAPAIVTAGLAATALGVTAFAAYKGAGFVKKMFGKFI